MLVVVYSMTPGSVRSRLALSLWLSSAHPRIRRTHDMPKMFDSSRAPYWGTSPSPVRGSFLAFPATRSGKGALFVQRSRPIGFMLLFNKGIYTMATDTDTENLLNRADLAQAFDVSLPTIDSWIRKGCPYRQRGSNGKAWQFSLPEVARWREMMARQSEQDWRGGHVKPPSAAEGPELMTLLGSRTDLRNPIRFFIEDGLRDFLHYWLTIHPWSLLRQIHEETGNKVQAVRLLQQAVGPVLGMAASWIMEDRYSACFEGDSLDAIWRDATGVALERTRAPDDPGALLFAGLVPRFIHMEPEEFVTSYWEQGELPDPEGMQVGPLEEATE